ncbi:flagellar basal-body MS-ring/collar protein FliF [Zymomonas sp.]|uniref:flagellar basal-body MS-ring/collar protein FliF n=1 Tax=Zymomonas sp. TaxID=2068624 RepID=UPI0025E0C050|nr:flagellar basal-body MS-ring/collar protein FliF [Zymomonas sp.]MCA1955213.1 flagellar M-ring protein FliF [Zymomonas sp.]
MADVVPTPDDAAGSVAVPAPSNALANFLANNNRVNKIYERVKDFVQQPAIKRSLPLMGLVSLTAIGALIWFLLSAPPQRDLYPGAGDADRASIASALETGGIHYNINRGNGVITVSEKDYYKARMLLAQQGLPKSAPDGDHVISSLPLGASRAVEGERLRAAREVDLARTIETIDVVNQARVHIAEPQPSPFVREQVHGTASVMLKLMTGRNLSNAQVQAIQNLVAASVPGMAPEAVSVVDQAGHLLSATSNADNDIYDRQLRLQQTVEARYMDALNKLLVPLLGENNYTAEVHTDLDFTESQATRESYPKEGSLRSESGSWNKDGGPDQNGGIPGAMSNMPPTPANPTQNPPPNLQPPAQPNNQQNAQNGQNGQQGQNAQGQQNAQNGQQGQNARAPGSVPAETAQQAQSRTSENFNRYYELGREVSVIRNPTGSVKRVSVAIALRQINHGKPPSPEQVAQLEKLIKGAIGFDASRGDVVAISSSDFMGGSVFSLPWYQNSWVPLLARNLSALLVAALVIFGFARPFLKARAEAAERRRLAENPLPQLETTNIDNLIAEGEEPAEEAGSHAITLDMIDAAPGYKARVDLVRHFVKQDPARAALVVHDMMRSDLKSLENHNG